MISLLCLTSVVSVRYIFVYINVISLSYLTSVVSMYVNIYLCYINMYVDAPLYLLYLGVWWHDISAIADICCIFICTLFLCVCWCNISAISDICCTLIFISAILIYMLILHCICCILVYVDVISPLYLTYVVSLCIVIFRCIHCRYCLGQRVLAVVRMMVMKRLVSCTA